MKQKIKQMIADFLRKLIKLDDYIDDYIEDKVISELEDFQLNLETEVQEIRELSESNEYELNERPNFYDLESQVEELVNNELSDLVERIEALEEAWKTLV